MIDQIENNLKENTKEVKTKTLTYISTALGLVAGLAWNDAIKGLIEFLFPLSKNTLLAQFLYAILVTVVVVILIKQIDKIFKE